MGLVSQARTQDLEQAKVSLDTNEERYRALVEFSPDAIFIHHHHRIIYTNLAGCRLLGATEPDQLLARSLLSFVHPDYQARVEERITAIVTKVESVPALEAKFIRLDHTEVDVEVIGVPFCAEEGIGVQTIARDITVRKRTEEKNARLLEEVKQQRAHLRVLNQRLAEIQEHERKTLARELHDRVGQNLTALGIDLTIIKTQIAVDKPLADKVSACLNEACDLVVQTTELVRDVMADLHPSMLDDYGLLATLAWYGDLVSRRTGLGVVVKKSIIPLRLPETVEFTLFRIAQEAFNNVIKHALARQIVVYLTVDNGVVRLTIADNGCGLDRGRLEGESVRPSWGLLTMSERAEAIGGRCWLESEAGQGTTVIVEIMQ